jgi:hypothetical protein
LNAFPNWEYWNSGKLENDINATDIRDGFFTFCDDLRDEYSKFAGTVWRNMVSEPVKEIMKLWRTGEEYNRLREELRFVKKYKKS